MDTTRPTIGLRLQRLREQKGLTLAEAARRAKLSLEQATAVESGHARFNSVKMYAQGMAQKVRITGVAGVFRKLNLETLSEKSGLDLPTVTQCVQLIASPENAATDCETRSLERVLAHISLIGKIELADY